MLLLSECELLWNWNIIWFYYFVFKQHFRWEGDRHLPGISISHIYKHIVTYRFLSPFFPLFSLFVVSMFLLCLPFPFVSCPSFFFKRHTNEKWKKKTEFIPNVILSTQMKIIPLSKCIRTAKQVENGTEFVHSIRSSSFFDRMCTHKICTITHTHTIQFRYNNIGDTMSLV